MAYTPIEDIPVIRNELRATFRKGTTKPIAWRRHQLLQLGRMAQDNAELFAEALAADLGRPKMEAYFAEVGVIVERSIICANKLEEWTRPSHPEVVEWAQTWKSTVHSTPKGIILIIAPWNYPMILSLQPLYGAISAGCCAAIKVSEIAPNYANLLATLLPKYLDQSAYRVILGAVPEITKTLELQWDHIFYTGHGAVARVIAAAAAKHLTPMTLELGGKSPVIIDDTCDIDLAAKRILWGKINNAGQICVCPDFVLINREKQEEFVAALKKHHDNFFPDGPLKSDSFSRIVSDFHFTRLKNLLARTKGTIVLGGGTGERRGLEPTVVKDILDGDSLLEEELFGPILPIVPVDSVDDAIELINSRNHPLVLYAFTNDEKTKVKIRENTMSGNLVFNDTFQQLAINELPFGGVGESGYGRQVLKYSYDNFVYERTTIDVPKEAESFLEARYPPYTPEKFEFMAMPVNLTIPPSTYPESEPSGHGSV